MKIIKFNNNNFFAELDLHLSKRIENSQNIYQDVEEIIKDVKKNGNEALIKYAKKIDNIDLSENDIKLKNFSSKENVDTKILLSFEKAIKNITNFHKKQLPNNYEIDQDDLKLKSVWRPLESVGLYIPGSNAAYPSSLIMSVIPAKVAGVKRIVCVTPPTKTINPYILKLFEILNIDEVYLVGGAQAIAALSYGTETIKPVNKIFGPGNEYVSTAKKQVFGKVGIDLIAGPSEILVVADDDNNPTWVASDLMAQAEHDNNAQSILITDSELFLNKVQQEIIRLSSKLSKKKIIETSLKNNGLIILVDDLNKSHEIINYIAPEHLHLHTKEQNNLLSNVKNAGCIFLGELASEAFGDYIVGTNHILPTSGAAKFSSGLSVIDYMKRSSIVQMNQNSYNNLHKDAEQMAEVEGLDAHKLSVKIRQTSEN